MIPSSWSSATDCEPLSYNPNDPGKHRTTPLTYPEVGCLSKPNTMAVSTQQLVTKLVMNLWQLSAYSMDRVLVHVVARLNPVRKQLTRIILCLHTSDFQLPYNCKACCSECYSNYYQQLMCRVFLLSTAVLECCNQTNSEKNITPIFQSWTQHTHFCSSYFNDCSKSIKSVKPRSSTCSVRHPTAKH